MGLKSKLQADKNKKEEAPIYQTSMTIEQENMSELMIRLKATEGYLSTFLKEKLYPC